MEEFDSEKIINMSREELIGLLGVELSAELNKKLANGTLTYKEFDEIFKKAIPIPERARLVRNSFFLKLSKSEGFSLFETNKEKQQQYAEIAYLQERADKGEINKQDLKRLCDLAFGKDTILSQHMQTSFILSGKVKETPEEKEEKERD